MAKPYPWFPWEVQANQNDAELRLFSLEEYGAYCRLMEIAWLNACKLPDDCEDLARLLGVERVKFERIWLRVSKRFKPDGCGALVCAELLEKYAEAVKRTAVAREKGKLGGRPSSKRKSSRKATALQQQSQGKAIDINTDMDKDKDSSKTQNPLQPTVAGPNGPSPAREDPARVVFEHWNGLSALKHHGEFTDKMRNSVNARLKARPLSDLLRAVTRYAELVQAETAPGWCKWGLGELMSRGEGTAIDDMLNPNYRGITPRSPPTIGERNRAEAEKFVRGDFS